MEAKAAAVGEDSITLEGRDKGGKRVHATLTARIISPSKESQRAQGRMRLVKEEDDNLVDDAQSWAEDAEGGETYDQKGIVKPPYSLTTLATLRERSTELAQAIQAMVTNVVGFGWQLRERRMPDEAKATLREAITLERYELESKLEVLHPFESLTMMMEKVQWDKHATGVGYLEVVQNKAGQLAACNHVASHSVRMSAREKRPVLVEVPRVRPDLDYKVETLPMYYRFRRYVQLREDASGTVKGVWFKEAGDPRTLDRRTGEYVPRDTTLPFKYQATSMICFRRYSPVSCYGVPDWIGNLYSILGSRAAEHINYQTLCSNAMPSMMVIIENGVLTKGSIQRLRQWTEQHVQNAQNFSSFLILEGETQDEGSPTPGQFRIKVEPLKRLQQTDELYQEYDQNNRDKVRQSFRLPPIFVGRSDDYNRATADTSRSIADEQVFAPERQYNDHLLNRHIMSLLGARFHTLRFNHPNITDDAELVRMAAIAERSGGMTPRRMDRVMRDIFGDELGPLPTGISLDQPYSLQFAQAQGGGGQGGQTPGDAVADGNALQGETPDPNKSGEALVNSLVGLRESIEKELESRLLLGKDS